MAQEPAAQKRAVAPKTGSVAAAEPVESVAAHVSEVFGKEMAHLRGDLQSDAAAAKRASAPASAVENLVAMLRDPRTVRQLVLVREVLDEKPGAVNARVLRFFDEYFDYRKAVDVFQARVPQYTPQNSMALVWATERVIARAVERALANNNKGNDNGNGKLNYKVGGFGLPDEK